MRTIIAVLLAVWPAVAWAQGQPVPPPPAPTSLTTLIASARPDAPATLTFANRDIVVLRSSILGRSSTDRVLTAQTQLQQFVAGGAPARATMRLIDGALMFSVDGHFVFLILPTDLDELTGETLDTKGPPALSRLQLALDETLEARTPRLLLLGALEAVAATAVFIAIVWGLRRADRVTARWIAVMTERRVSASLQAPLAVVRQSRLVTYGNYATNLVMLAIGLIAGYLWLMFVLRRFPYSRPWGDAIRQFLIDRLAWLGLGVVHAIPGLATVALIVVLTRVALNLLGQLFDAVEHGHVTLRGLYPETVAPTRKIVAGLFWLFALIVAYPYIPGSGTDAFKGVSVFVGIVVSLGSTGIVNQLMSGLTITYSRALRSGDYVRIGDVEGTVMHVGTLSTKVETPRGEDVTIPNTVVISHEVINYSRNMSASDVRVPTVVTIGYDVPWRQVQAMLLLAASRTAGVRQEPAPLVLQSGLEDFSVKYTLVVSIDEPRRRALTLSALHANIQDAFNESGVQIMSPHYENDPAGGPKVVPKDRWFPPPAGA